MGRSDTMKAMVLPEIGAPLEGAEEAHALLRNNALVGRAALIQPHG